MSHRWQSALIFGLLAVNLPAEFSSHAAAEEKPQAAPAAVPAAEAEKAPVKAAAGTDSPKSEVKTVGAVDAPAENATKYPIVYKFKEGQVVRYEVSHEGEITITFNAATQIDRNKSETRKKFRVVAVGDDGSGRLELMIDWVHMMVKSGEKPPVIFKSDDPKFRPAIYDPILETVGKPQAVITFSRFGSPLKVDASPGAVANQPAKLIPAQADASPESYLCPLPDHPVAVGETWKERFELTAQASDKLPVKIAMLRGYRLMSVENNRANIEFKTSILSPVHDPAISAQLIQRETKGKIVFDLEQGQIVSRDVDVDRTVINPFGPKSSMRAVSTFHERLQTGPVTARKP